MSILKTRKIFWNVLLGQWKYETYSPDKIQYIYLSSSQECLSDKRCEVLLS